MTHANDRWYHASPRWYTRSVASYQRPCRSSLGGRRKRLHSIGVSVSDTNPETKMATPIVTANS